MGTPRVRAVQDRLRELVGRMSVGAALPSVAELKRTLPASQGTIEKAFELLQADGLILRRKGKGVFVADGSAGTGTPVHADPSLHNDEDLTARFIGHSLTKRALRIHIPLGGDPLQIDMWRHALAGFEEEQPFLDVVPSFEATEAAEADVALVTPSSQPPVFRAFERARLTAKGIDLAAIPPDLLRLGEMEAGGTRLGALPVLRTSAMVLVNTALLAKCGLAPESIRKPKDLFAVGEVVERTLGGDVRGLRYLGLSYHAALYGFAPRWKGSRCVIDRDLLGRFLAEAKPHIKPHHLRDSIGSHSLQLLLTGRYAVYPCLSYLYSLVDRSGFRESQVIPIPRLPDGFGSEGVWLAAVTERCEQEEDALALLRYLLSVEGQRRFAERLPYWISVRRDVVEEQKQSSPFAAGALNYDFDWRSLWGYHPFQVPDALGSGLATETAKYFSGVQTLNRTLQRIERQAEMEMQKPL